MYSGRVAAAGISAVEWPDRAILLGPNHRGRGSAAALSPAGAWATPLGDVSLDRDLATALLAACPDLTEDEEAHEEEHSLEVLLPFLQAVRPALKIAALSIGEPSLALSLSVGRAVAHVVTAAESAGTRVALVVSSDLNHYLARAANRKKDDRALEALLAGDPEELFTRVLSKERITMCGILPATALLEALRLLGAGPGRVLARGDSADAGAGEDRVVGYASVLWENREVS